MQSWTKGPVDAILMLQFPLHCVKGMVLMERKGIHAQFLGWGYSSIGRVLA